MHHESIGVGDYRKEVIEPYKGKFGIGYLIKTPLHNNRQYVKYTYYIKKPLHDIQKGKNDVKRI